MGFETLGFGTTKLYQTDWNGISLIDIQEELGVPREKIASSDFYRYFYKILEENGFTISDEWAEEKRRLGRAVFDKIDPQKNNRILSLGAGLGICELEAIRGGIA